MLRELRKSAKPGITTPISTPIPMARNIHKVRYRFRNDNFLVTLSAIVDPHSLQTEGFQ
jgi:hypothetical protein